MHLFVRCCSHVVGEKHCEHFFPTSFDIVPHSMCYCYTATSSKHVADSKYNLCSKCCFHSVELMKMNVIGMESTVSEL